MKEQCIVFLNSFKSQDYDSKHILDTTNLSIEETVHIVNDNRFELR